MFPRHSNWAVIVTLVIASGACLVAADDPVVFKSDVAMTRVDAKVVDGEGRAVTGLGIKDFVLTLNGKTLPVRSLASENVPIDILLLLDVSGSMEPHVQRIASAARQALNVLAEKDRVGIMMFDTRSTLRLPLRNNRDEVTTELNRILRSEHFSGGTRITQAMMDAARYLEHSARPEARRAVVILTDDQTQDEEDESRVEAALNRANAVLSFLQAPYEPPQGGVGFPGGGGRRRRGGTWGGGGGWPGGGGGWPGGGGIGFPGGGNRGGMGGGDRSHTAGTDTIAADSGGDTIPVNDASALEETFEKLRQRYALYCYLPDGQTAEGRQSIRVSLSPDAQLHYRDAQVQSRRVFMNGNGASETSGPTTITRAHTADTTEPTASETAPKRSQPQPPGHSRPVNEDSGEKVNTLPPEQ